MQFYIYGNRESCCCKSHLKSVAMNRNCYKQIAVKTYFPIFGK